ncbi:Cysteine desulfurase, SufS subfamily [Caenispirillum salinarum AK4]|uniref:Cysteine desulfurase n=1 Tax=Caenispirillum salinarum AK4 TaxID=1238182 RepID=K9GW27_9PROT|nr:cysteine desulfurase [Caenispirillum salinarum]EKV30135.1 Cysteine desulfurase, SufS subfamily [Caenispirillum salinarum AK4]
MTTANAVDRTETATIAPEAPGFDVAAVRADFPILAQTVRGKPLTYLDSGASAQKPKAVIDAITSLYTHDYANVHRGAYSLSEKSTSLYEGSREIARRFINAESTREVVFTKGATEAINLVANTYGRSFLSEGDEVIISELEHHSNIVPWQMLRDEKGLVLKVVPITDDGAFDLEAFKGLLTERTKIVSVAHVSNVLGTVLPVKEITQAAHAVGARVLVDGCQGAVHIPVDVQDLDCDFYVFSGHKLYGPTGVGILYGKEALLDAMPPWQGGGDMIATVTFEKSTWAELPAKFEAGTPPISAAIALGAAMDYVSALGLEKIAAHEHALLNYAQQQLASVEGLTLYGTTPGKCAVMSFTMDCAHPHDIATILDQSGVCIRAGHHCAQPVMERFGVPAMGRASLGMYNTRDDIDRLIKGLGSVRKIFG